VVLEVRDARIPFASHHPEVRNWIGDKPRILILNREDMITESIRNEWREWLKSQGEIPFFTNAFEYLIFAIENFLITSKFYISKK
jgi:ribosome biogenesis GTPase A